MDEISRRGALAVLAGGVLAGPARAQTTDGTLADAGIRALLADFIERGQSLGVAVGVATPAGRRFVTHGVLSRADPRPVGAGTLFGIASITKSFTGLLLAEAVRRGEVRLDDPLAGFLPAGTRVPARAGRQITLLDLATHTAGLPIDPPRAALGEPSRDAADPWAPLHAALADLQLTRDIGQAWSYSNMGYGLLGEVLSRRAGLAYPELVRRRILAPLGLRDTGFSLSPAQAARRAKGHLASLAPAPEGRRAWTLPAGGLMSTVADLTTYAAAFTGLTRTPLAPAMAATRAILRPSPLFGGDYGFGWVVIRQPGGPIVTHGGLGGGFAACVAFDPARRTAAVVLSNAAPMVQNLGVHVLRATIPLGGPQAMTVAPDAGLDQLVGSYRLDADLATQRLAKGAAITVVRRPTGVAMGLPGLPAGLLSARAEGGFTIAGFPVSVAFDPGPGGPAAGLMLTIAGQSAHATREP